MSKYLVQDHDSARLLFEAKLGAPIDLLVASPGRVNLIGEHTDYNLGFSVPSAINRYVFLGFAITALQGAEDLRLEVHSLDFQQTAVITGQPTKEPHGWVNYLSGIVDRFQQLKGPLKGHIRVAVAGNLEIGSGVSSSAALSVGFAYGLERVFKTGFSKAELALVAQWTEHNYAGSKCGLLDQTAILFSKGSSFIKVDFKTGEKSLHTVEFPFSVILLHCGVSHSLPESCYNQRVSECKQATQAILAAASKQATEKSTLRDCSLEDLALAKATLDPVLYLRAKYVIEENKRVDDILQAIGAKDFARIKEIMHATHSGLSHEYEVSLDRLDFLADESQKLEEAFGARLMGGGFGGCTINLVHQGQEAAFIAKMAAAFKAKFDEELRSFPVKLSQGVHATVYSEQFADATYEPAE